MPAVRALLSLATPLLLVGCEPAAGPDFLHLDLGNTWEYRLVEGEGEVGEAWIAEIRDDDDNNESARGQVMFEMRRTYADTSLRMRAFNLSWDPELDVEGGWLYKWVEHDEGERNNAFVLAPGEDPDWSAEWSYEDIESGGSDFSHEVTAERSSEPVLTSYGTYSDTVYVHRQLTVVNYLSGVAQEPLVQERNEVWAEGVGLIVYGIQSSDGTYVEARLSATSVADRVGAN